MDFKKINIPEQRLARAVIARIWLDSFGIRITHNDTTAELERSKFYLEKKNIAQVKSYELWCDMAGIEPEYARTLYEGLTRARNNGSLIKLKMTLPTIIERLLEKP